MNLKKYFNLTFEQSEKITEGQLSTLSKNIKGNKSLKGKSWSDYFSLAGVNLLVAVFGALPFIMEDYYPSFFLQFSKGLIAFILIQVPIFLVVFIWALKTNNYIYEDLFTNLYLFVLLFPLAIIFSALILFASTKSIDQLTYSITLLIYLITAILMGAYVYLNYTKLFKDFRVADSNHEPSATSFKSYHSIESINRFIKNLATYGGIPLLVVIIFRLIYRLFFKGSEFGRTLKFIGLFIITGPIIVAFVVYLIFYYEPAGYLLPTYYLIKYQAEYEEKYQIKFAGERKK